MSRSTFVCAVLLSPIVVLGQDSWIPWCEHDDGNGGTICHYYRFTEPGTWKEVKAEAVLHGGHLVTINDGAENAFVLATFATPGDGIWIGLEQDLDDPLCTPNCEPDGGWKWINGKPKVFDNWSPGEPNNAGESEHHGQMYSQDNVNLPGGWNDGNQATVLRGVVERESLDGWIEWCGHDDGNGGTTCHYYRLTRSNPTWELNQVEAVSAGGYLVAIGSQEENDFVLNKLGSQIPDAGFNIGFFQDLLDPSCTPNCEPGMGWKWINGEPITYTNWRAGEPNNLGVPPENVASMHWFNHPDAGTWYDVASVQSYGVIERESNKAKIPAVSTWGMVTMLLLVLAAGTIVLMKRRAMIGM